MNYKKVFILGLLVALTLFLSRGAIAQVRETVAPINDMQAMQVLMREIQQQIIQLQQQLLVIMQNMRLQTNLSPTTPPVANTHINRSILPAPTMPPSITFPAPRDTIPPITHPIAPPLAKNGYILNVTKTGEGNIISNPQGINCGADCDESYSLPTHSPIVTLIATPLPEWIFIRWEGDCRGISPRCAVHMSAARNVKAIFMPIITNTNQGPVFRITPSPSVVAPPTRALTPTLIPPKDMAPIPSDPKSILPPRDTNPIAPPPATQ